MSDHTVPVTVTVNPGDDGARAGTRVDITEPGEYWLEVQVDLSGADGPVVTAALRAPSQFGVLRWKP